MNVKLKKEIEETLKKQHRQMRENRILIIGLLIGIVGSLIAGVINDLIKNSNLYPKIYLLILVIILFVLILIFLTPYFGWKRFQYKINKKIIEMKKLIDQVEEHKIKYGKVK